jgi:hypothetical protein
MSLQAYLTTHNVLVFFLGCIGASAPEIVRLYNLRYRPIKGAFSLWYFLASAPLFVLGGVIALALPATTPWGAFYAGVTTPMLISTATKHRQKSPCLANEDHRNVIHAIDQSESGTPTIQASQPDVPQPSRLKKFIELLRDHADGLFI